VLKATLPDDLLALGILQGYKTVAIDILPRRLLVYVTKLNTEACIDKF